MKGLPPAGGFTAVSPDGRWLARIAREGAVSQLYVQALGRPGLRVTLAQAGGARPVWSRDGRWLYFTSERQLFQCAVRIGDMFSNDAPTVLFTLDGEIREFDVSPDGQRFLVTRVPSPDFTPFQLLVNWRAKLATALKGGSWLLETPRIGDVTFHEAPPGRKPQGSKRCGLWRWRLRLANSPCAAAVAPGAGVADYAQMPITAQPNGAQTRWRSSPG